MNDELPVPVTRQHYITNYLGCAGRFQASAAQLSQTNANVVAQIDNYAGLLTLNKQNKISSATDGLSNTILFGEVTGGFTDGNTGSGRNLSFSWLCGPIGVHFQTRPLTTSTTLPAAYSRPRLEDSKFSSRHAGDLIQYAFGDVSVKGMSRSVDIDVLLAQAGRADGVTFSSND